MGPAAVPLVATSISSGSFVAEFAGHCLWGEDMRERGSLRGVRAVPSNSSPYFLPVGVRWSLEHHNLDPALKDTGPRLRQETG